MVPPPGHIVPNFGYLGRSRFRVLVEDTYFPEAIKIGDGGIAKFPMTGIPEHDGGNIQGKRLQKGRSVVGGDIEPRPFNQG